MQERPTKLVNTRVITVIDTVIFFILVAVSACRLFISESLYDSYPMPGQSGGGGLFGFGSAGLMLTFNMTVFLAGSFWLAARFWSGNLCWHRTSLCMPAILLLVAAVISVNRASNVYLAFSDALNLLAATILCLIMVQLLTASLARRQLLLVVILALGGTLCVRCYQQKAELAENVQAMQQDYNGFMQTNGLDPQSWQARQFEERVMSMDTGGYFPVSNTAASYLLLAGGAALALAAAGGKLGIPASLAAFAVVTWGIFITDSTGGKVGLILLIPTALVFHGLRRAKKRRLLFAGFIIAVLAAIAVVAGYGITHDRLPTSNLWIRWQYWQATAKMIADHWLTGVGPQNFGIYYPLYMNPASPEVVKDPHCVGLAILSQWGVIGFIAVVWAALAVVWQLVKNNGQASACETTGPACDSPRRFLAFAGGLAACVAVAYLASCDQTRGELPGMVIFYIIFTRVGVFLALLVGIWFLIGHINSTGKLASNSNSLAGLLAGLAVFALHNSIDFAFFTPGVMLLFSLLTALTLAIKNAGCHSDHTRHYTFRPSARFAAIVVVVGIFITWFYAGRSIYAGQNYLTHAASYTIAASKQNRADLLEQAATYAGLASQANSFDPTGYKYAADLKATLWQSVRPVRESLFRDSLTYLEQAAALDRANGSYYQVAGELCLTRSQTEPQPAQTALLTQADKYLTEALKSLPGDCDLLVMLAQVRSLQGDLVKAKELAQKALEIETNCMAMQAKLFPHRQTLYPRLSQARQQQAQKILAQ